jgi:hypothetical protein
MPPVQINMTTTKEGIQSITKLLVANEVSSVQAKSFLKHLGLNAEAQEQIVDQALDNKVHQFPSSWYDTEDLSVFVEVPMHLLMLGVMKAVMLKIGKWLRSNNQNATFINHISGKLKVIKKLNIEWCKILEYPTTETTGGWVSENFAAMARLGMWFYSHLYDLNYAEEYKEPDVELNKWNKNQCEKWLQVRGLARNGSVMELRKIIEAYITNETIPNITKKKELVLTQLWIW